MVSNIDQATAEFRSFGRERRWSKACENVAGQLE